MKTPTTMRPLRHVVASVLALSVVLPAVADYSSTVLSKNPVGYWRFNQTNQPPALAVATNYGSAAAAANGYYVNGVKQLVDDAMPATTDSAPFFDGFSQKVEVPFNAALNSATAFTVEAWVRPMLVDGYDNKWYRAVVRSGTQQDGGGYQIQFDTGTTATPNGVFKFTLWNGGSALEVFKVLAEPGNILATNNGPWAQLVGTWSSSDGIGRIYVNGVELTNRTYAYTPNTNAPLRIGGGDIGPTDPWGQSFDPGPICKVAVYGTQLTPTQIAAHYQNGTNTAPATPYASLVASDSPAGFWPLNETNIPAQPVLTNLGSVGALLDGRYNYNSTPGVAGAQAPNYGGLETNNLAAHISADGGSAWVPPVNLASNNVLTITAWIKRNGNQMGAATIFGRRVPGGEKSAFGFDGGGLNKLSYNWDDNASQYNFDTKLTVPDNVWTFAALVITPTNALVYMDYGAGLQWASNNFANTTLLGFTHEILMGPSGPYGGRRFNGSIDEVAVFTNALTVADMWDLRNAAFGSGLFLASQPVGHPVMLGGKVPFTAIAAGSTNYMPFSYQLLKNGLPEGAPGSSSTIVYGNIQAADVSSAFSISVTTNGGSVATLTSSAVGLTRWTVPGEYSEIIESYGPAAYYRFSETSGTVVYDVAQALDGATVGAISRTSGPVPTDFAGFLTNNGAYTGNGGYIPVLGPAISGSNVTIAMWANPSSGTQIAYSGLYYTRGADYAGFTYGPSGNTELGISWNGHFNDHSLVFAQPNVWNFIAFVLGDIIGPTGPTNACTFYCYTVGNGWQSNSIYGAGGFPARNLAGGQGTAISNDPNTGLNRPAKGILDEVIVINRTLTFDDINKLAMAGVNTHVSIQPAGGNNYNVGWSYGTLQSAPEVMGPWTAVGGAVAPSYLDTQSSTQKFYKVVP